MPAVKVRDVSQGYSRHAHTHAYTSNKGNDRTHLHRSAVAGPRRSASNPSKIQRNRGFPTALPTAPPPTSIRTKRAIRHGRQRFVVRTAVAVAIPDQPVTTTARPPDGLCEPEDRS